MMLWFDADKNFLPLLNALPIPLAIHDDAGTMLFFNRAFEETFGYTLADVPTLDAWWPTAYPDPEYRRQLAAAWREYMEEAVHSGRPFAQMEADVRCKDGSVRTISCRAAPLGDGAAGIHLAILYDLTEQKRIEAELRMTRASVEASSDAIYWIAPDARILDVNAAACAVLGYSREELLQMCVPDIDPHFTMQVWNQTFPELRQKGVLSFQTEQRTRDGRILPIEVVANHVRFGAQEFSCAFCRDITVRKEAERKLQESEERFKAFMDNAPSIAWMKDEQFRYVYVNKTLQGLCGIRSADFLGKTDFDLWATDFAELFRKNDLEVLHSGKSAIVEEQAIVDGKQLYSLNSKFLFRDAAGRSYIGGVGVDITERKRAEAELRVSQEKYYRLIEGLGDRFCVFSHTVDGVFVYVSRNFEKLFGIPAKEIVGRNWRAINLTAESLQAGEASDRRLLEELSVQTVELTCLHPDGSRHIIEVTYGPVVRDGCVVLMEGICADVTEIRENALALARAKEAAEVASRAKSDFLANISHEIRTPITAIVGYAELLQETELAACQRTYLETVNQSAETLLALVDDILDLAKIEAGKVELERELFSLREIVDEVVGSQSPAALAKGLLVHRSVEAGAPDALSGDPLRLKQILHNLLGNAVKFTESGEVTLSVVVEECQPSTVLLRFDVADTGIGIKPADMPRIFQPFSQADSSMTRKYGGTGLGLAISTQLAELMGGRIWAESSEGRGSIFHVRIPFAFRKSDAAPGRQPPAARSALWEGRPLRILLVEDNDISQQFFCEVLTRHGHHVETARNGAEGVRKWVLDSYDMILMDLQMPTMDGFEAVRMIREAEVERGGHVPIVALTARAMEEDRQNVLGKGFDGYVSKPMKIRDLLDEMRRCLPV